MENFLASDTKRLLTRPLPKPAISQNQPLSNTQAKKAQEAVRRRGAAVEDLGSGFLPSPTKRTNTNKSGSLKSNGKPPSGPVMHSVVLDDFLDSESEDELDTLSYHGSDFGSPPPGARKRKEVESKKEKEKKLGVVLDEDEEGVVDADGRYHEFHPQYKPEKVNVLKGLKFKKTKPSGEGDEKSSTLLGAPSSSPHPSKALQNNSNVPSSSSQPPQSSSSRPQRTASQNHTSRPPLPTRRKRSPTPERRVPASRSRSKAPERGTNHNPRPNSKPNIILKLNSSSTSINKPIREPTTSDARPRPRPVGRAASVQIPKPFPGFETDLVGPSVAAASSPARRMTVSGTRPFPLDTRPSSPGREPAKEKLKAKEFPMLSPGQETSLKPTEFPVLTPLGAKGRGREISAATVKKPVFRNGSTLVRDKGKEMLSSSIEFPIPSPLSSQGNGKAGSSQGKPKRKSTQRIILSDDEDGDEEEESGVEGLKAQPFPMSTQVLGSIGSVIFPECAVAGPSSLGKRPSPGGEGGRENKKNKMDRNGDGYTTPIVLDDDYVFEEDDTLIISPSTDPRTLCPYCDTPLPPSPTRLLTRLLASTAKKSHHEPRPANPLGRKAPFAVFIAVCQRHRFESQILPEAEAKGWPKEIEWHELGARVRRMKDALKGIAEDCRGDCDGEGLRKRCVFWEEVMQEVKLKGSRAVAGVRGQFANFEKTQPGYYGELGSVIIHQTLYDLFPPASIDPNAVAPLTPNEFVQRILVPEVGARLIMEDMGLDDSHMEDAVRILRESANYGVAMFPADEGEEGEGEGEGVEKTHGRGRSKNRDGSGGGGGGKLGAADSIIMERARKRRKELEADERREMEAEAEKQKKEEEEKRKGQQGAKKKGKEKDQQNAHMRPTRPKPRPLGKTTSTVSVDVDMVPEDVIELDANDGDTDLDMEPESLGRGKARSMFSPTVSDFTGDEATPRKPSMTLSRAPSAVDIDLCSSSDDAEIQSDISTSTRDTSKRKNRRLKTARQYTKAEEDDFVIQAGPPSSIRTPVATRSKGRGHRSESENADMMEETPKPRLRGDSYHSDASSPAVSSSWETMYPLKRAYQRKGDSTVGPSAGSTTPLSLRKNESYSWLLSDSSSMDSVTNSEK